MWIRDRPKIHDKNIIRLDTDEVAMLLDYIEHCGDTLTGQKRMYHEKTKDRDLAIVTLLLGTGIRVSECVGLDVEDVDFKNNGIKVTRKGGKDVYKRQARMVRRCCEIKAGVVERDPKEQGERALLNLGHTAVSYTHLCPAEIHLINGTVRAERLMNSVRKWSVLP